MTSGKISIIVVWNKSTSNSNSMFILTFASKVIKWKNEYYLAFDGNTLSLTKLKKWQMIDSIKIILRDFSGDLKNCIPKPSRKLIERWKGVW